MIRLHHVSARLSFIAPLALLAFSSCSAQGPDDHSPANTMDSNATDSNANGSNTNGSNTRPSNAGTAASNTNPTPASTDTTPSNTNTPPAASNTTPYNVDVAPSDMGNSDMAPSDMGDSDTAPDMDMAQVGQGLASPPSLGAAESFSILASSTVTCANSSAVTGDIGVSPGIAITGFDASCTLSGALHAKDPVADAAHQDLLTAFDTLTAASCEQDLTGVELGGLTLSPGVYCFDTTAGVTGTLTLDAGGAPNAAWIFQVGSAITTATGSSIVMLGGGDPCNVFWKVGSSATLGTNSAFSGNLLASASITLTSGSSLAGRALALNAAVTSDANVVSGCAR